MRQHLFLHFLEPRAYDEPGQGQDDEGAGDGADHGADAFFGDDREVDVQAQGSHGHAQDEVSYLDQHGDGQSDGGDIGADGTGCDEAAHEPGDGDFEFLIPILGLTALAPGFADTQDDGDRGQEQDAR